MKYIIYIDESGTLNNFNKNTIFSVSLAIIKERYRKKTKNYFKKQLIKTKKQFNIDVKKELKAYWFVKNNKKDVLYEIKSELNKKYVFDFCGYIRNKGINQKWLNNKNVTYNFIVKSVLERVVERLTITSDDEIIIFADNREINTGSFNSLSEYLEAEFVLKGNIKNIEIEFVDSKEYWGIQMADFISYINYDEIRKNKNLKNKRKIY